MGQIQRTISVEGGQFRNRATGATVTATCWNNDGDHPAVSRYPIEGRDAKGLLVISVKEKYAVKFGDWIIEDGDNTYVATPERFAADFEEITEQPA